MKKVKIISLLLAVLTILSVPVFAADAESPADPIVDIEEVTLKGYTAFVPTASTSYLDGENAQLPTSFLFDRKSETRLNVTVSTIDSFDVCTSTSVTKALGAFGVIVNGKEGSTAKISVYGSNDPYAETWDPLLLEMGDPIELGDYTVFKIGEKYIKQYLYYKFEITAEGCGDITITELLLLKSDSHGPELEWDHSGDEPKLVPVKSEKKTNAYRGLLINRFFSIVK